MAQSPIVPAAASSIRPTGTGLECRRRVPRAARIAGACRCHRAVPVASDFAPAQLLLCAQRHGAAYLIPSSGTPVANFIV